MFRFNRLLEANAIPPEDTVVLLHTPVERKLARLLPFLAVESPDILDAYQSVHSSRVTSTFRKRGYMASFVRVASGRLAFVGLYRIQSVADRPTAEICATPAMRRVLDEFGANRELEAEGTEVWPVVELDRLSVMDDLVGRLQIAPRLTQSYARLADRLDAEIVELSAESVLVPTAPDWRDFIVTGSEVRTLPAPWAARLREWRGIYLIVDRSDGARYVGSAYGTENLLGRWRTHVPGDWGVTVELRLRSPLDFSFSILERVNPDWPVDEVVALERSWMDRLQTISHGLNR